MNREIQELHACQIKYAEIREYLFKKRFNIFKKIKFDESSLELTMLSTMIEKIKWRMEDNKANISEQNYATKLLAATDSLQIIASSLASKANGNKLDFANHQKNINQWNFDELERQKYGKILNEDMKNES